MSKYEPVFYLKINQNADVNLKCFWHWVEICEELSADFYVVCDKPDITDQLIKNYSGKGYTKSMKVIPSYWETAKTILEGAIEGARYNYKWLKCGTALLTPFLHAKENAFTAFWNVDADDSILFASREICANAIKKASEYADTNEINCFGLDFHYIRSYRYYKHWTFGCVYTRNDVNYTDIIFAAKRLVPKWVAEDRWRIRNFDELFTNLGHEKLLSVVPFYIENMIFIHLRWMANICVRKKMTHLHLGNIIKPEILLKKIIVPKECVRIDADLSKDEYNKWCSKNKVIEDYAELTAGMIMETRQENERLQNEIVVHMQENEKNKNQVVALKQENEKIQNQVVALKQENEKLQGQIVTYREANEKLQVQIATHRQDIDEIKSDSAKDSANILNDSRKFGNSIKEKLRKFPRLFYCLKRVYRLFVR